VKQKSEKYESPAGEIDIEVIRNNMDVSWFVVIIIAYIILPFVVKTIFKTFPLPEIPGGAEKSSNVVVCDYRNYLFSWLMLICIGVGIGLMFTIPTIIQDSGIALAFMMLTLCFAFLGLAVVFVLMMKNKILIFYDRGIVCQTTFGKIYYYPNHKILGYHTINAPRNHSLGIKTTDRTIWINNYCNNYYEAKEMARKYPLPERDD